MISRRHKLLNGRRYKLRGFTLIEVLVAMTILAVGVSALVGSSGSSAFRSSVLREKEVGRWVASNHLTTLQSLPAWPNPGAKNTETEMLKQRWYINTRVRKLSDADLRRIDVEVRLKPDASSYIYSVTGFMGNPEHRL